MQKIDRFDKLIMKYVIITAIFILFIFNYENIFASLKQLWTITAPVIYGFIFAYILNLIMSFYEKHWFPETDNIWLNKARRPVAIILALITVFIVIFITLWLIIPQLVSLVQAFLDSIPIVIQFGQNLFVDIVDRFPELEDYFNSLNINWENIAREIASFTNNILGSTFTTVQIVASTVLSFVVTLVTAIYVLASKERFLMQVDRLAHAYLKKDNYRRSKYVVSVTDESFSSYLTGMLLEAVIYGSLVTVGMWIFRFPYAGMIGAMSGVLALVPMVGAVLSAAIGAILIFVSNPTQGFFFLIFNIVLQQLESNIIYPRVVGGSIGLPGLWTFISVTIGGAIMGPAGFFLGVPIASALYKMIQTNVEYREYQLETTGEVEFRQL